MTPFRNPPRMPVGAYQTYRIAAPIATHWRPATCAEVGCGAYERGWSTTVDESTDLGQQQAHYIRRLSGRGFTEACSEAGLTIFEFPPGQRCFSAGRHRVQVRPEIYLRQGGDWRGNPTGEVLRHANGDDWVDDFGEHQQQLAELAERG